jgi:broad specificity phosphatase PhoE
LDCLNRLATGKSLEQTRDFEILNASLNTLEFQEGQFNLIEWGNVSFLQDVNNQSMSLDELDGSPKWV